MSGPRRGYAVFCQLVPREVGHAPTAATHFPRWGHAHHEPIGLHEAERAGHLWPRSRVGLLARFVAGFGEGEYYFEYEPIIAWDITVISGKRFGTKNDEPWQDADVHSALRSVDPLTSDLPGPPD
jgi:hypothetical protein